DAGRLLDFNETACKQLGYTRAQLLSKRARDIRPGASTGTLQREMSELSGIAGQTNTVITEYRRKDGSTFPVESRRSLIDTPQGGGLSGARQRRARNGAAPCGGARLDVHRLRGRTHCAGQHARAALRVVGSRGDERALEGRIAVAFRMAAPLRLARRGAGAGGRRAARRAVRRGRGAGGARAGGGSIPDRGREHGVG